MSDNSVVDSVLETTAAGAESVPEVPAGPTVLSDLLVEDVSIDGMCGVY